MGYLGWMFLSEKVDKKCEQNVLVTDQMYQTGQARYKNAQLHNAANSEHVYLSAAVLKVIKNKSSKSSSRFSKTSKDHPWNFNNQTTSRTPLPKENMVYSRIST